MQKRKMNMIDDEDDDEEDAGGKQSDGSDYVASSGDDEFSKLSRKSMKKSMKGFINDGDDLEDIENRYTVRKRRAKTRNGRRATQRAGTRQSARAKKRKKYNDDTDSDGSDQSWGSGKSSEEDDGKRVAGRRLRERKPATYSYTQLSDEDEEMGEVIKKAEKEEDDGGDWGGESDQNIEEFDSDEYKSKNIFIPWAGWDNIAKNLLFT